MFRKFIYGYEQSEVGCYQPMLQYAEAGYNGDIVSGSISIELGSF